MKVLDSGRRIGRACHFQERSYISGVLFGDGWLSEDGSLVGLHVKDLDFARAFSDALKKAFAVVALPRPEGKYFRVRVHRKGRFKGLKIYAPCCRSCSSAWIRGLFDSDGNAQATRTGASPNSYSRRIVIFNTDSTILLKARRALLSIGIKSKIRATSAHLGAGHYGTKEVLGLFLRAGPENYGRFRDLVGSNIARKRKSLNLIADTYQERFVYCSRGGRRGTFARWGNRKTCGHGHPLRGPNLVVTRR